MNDDPNTCGQTGGDDGDKTCEDVGLFACSWIGFLARDPRTCVGAHPVSIVRPSSNEVNTTLSGDVLNKSFLNM